MRVIYVSNNSGGDWWLTDEDWKKLESAGWKVAWRKDGSFGVKDGRFLGALACEASKEFSNVEAAIDEWEEITGKDPYAEGCSCCGAPHYFREAYKGE